MPYKNIEDKRRFQRTWAKKKTAERKEAGLCVRCGKPTTNYYCAKCLEYRSEYKESRISKGLCIDCSKPLSSKSRCYCEKCLKRVNIGFQLIRKKWIEQGRCPNCGGGKMENENFKRCPNCRSKLYRTKEVFYKSLRKRGEIKWNF